MLIEAQKYAKIGCIWSTFSLVRSRFKPAESTPNSCPHPAFSYWRLCSAFWGLKNHGQKATEKHEWPLIKNMKRQTIAFLISKLKTYTYDAYWIKRSVSTQSNIPQPVLWDLYMQMLTFWSKSLFRIFQYCSRCLFKTFTLFCFIGCALKSASRMH